MAMKANFDGVWKGIKVKASDTLPIGTQVAYGGSTPPTNWLICDGSAISRTTYADLFAVIGTSYGEGDGSTTFNLPNNNIQPTEVDNWIIKAFQSVGVVANVAKTKTTSDTDTYSCNYINGLQNDLKQFGNPQKLTTEELAVASGENGLTLTQPYSNFDILLFLIRTDYNNHGLITIPKAFVSKKFNIYLGEYDDYIATGYCWISSDNKAMIKVRQIKGYTYLVLDSVYGIKF